MEMYGITEHYLDDLKRDTSIDGIVNLPPKGINMSSH